MEYKSEKDKLFDSIYRTYEADVYRACLYISRDQYLSQDVTQQAFLNFYERFEETQPQCIKAYLIQSAKNLLKNHYRDNKRFVENDENGDIPFADDLTTESIEEQYIEEEARIMKRKLTDEILVDLKESHESWYEILYMMYYRDMNHDQIVTELEISKEVLYSRLRRAKVWIQKNYKIEFEDMESDYL